MSKLYCIATSEKASKGQGGNEYLDIVINLYNDDRYTIKITPEKLVFMERGYTSPLLERYHKDIMQQEEGRLSYIKEKPFKNDMWACLESGKRKEEYEAGLCDSCWDKECLEKEQEEIKGKSQKGEYVCKWCKNGEHLECEADMCRCKH